MPRNGQGIYTLPVGNPVITGTTITSTWGNTTMQDIANALTGSVASDGQTTMSGPLNMGSNRINNVDNPVLPQDAATMDYVDTLVGDLGTMARQNADNVQITGGSITGTLINLSGTTGQFYLPRGTTAQRTGSPISGLMRWNTDTLGTQNGFYEGYTPAGWVRFVTAPEGNYDIEYLVIGGGGGGGGGTGGGGGAGGLRTGFATVIPGTQYTVNIGAGGTQSANGGDTSIVGLITAQGGGGGATNKNTGLAGGSGGGGGSDGFNGAGVGGNGTVGQGHNGGNGGFAADPRSDGGGGGGGGAGTIGGSAAPYGPAGNGGAGLQLSITGTPVYYAGGGGGGGGGGGTTPATAPGAGGAGGGGAGGAPTNARGQDGNPNTGGGGGGGGAAYGTGGNGGTGVVYMSMDTAVYSGITTGSPIVTEVGDKTILKFENAGSYTA